MTLNPQAKQDVVSTVAAIRHVLKRGGVWTNTGPLHYHSHAQIPLDWEDLRQVIETTGFELEKVEEAEEMWAGGRRLRTNSYDLIFFVARAL